MSKKKYLTKLENHNLKQRFISDFGSGKYKCTELAKLYKVDRRKLLRWKKQLFGKGSLRRKRMYQMHLANIPTKTIAEFYNCTITEVHRSIKIEKKRGQLA